MKTSTTLKIFLQLELPPRKFATFFLLKALPLSQQKSSPSVALVVPDPRSRDLAIHSNSEAAISV